MSKHRDASAPESAHRSRRLRRLHETQELQVRTTHRRRKFLTRGGVLAGFALAMVIYPIQGTIAPFSSDAAEAVTGGTTAQGEPLSSSRALLGDGPQLLASELPLPNPDDTSTALATSAEFVVNSNLPDCDTSVGWSGSNGRMSEESMCTIWNGVRLRNDAAVALTEMNEAFKLEFGRSLYIDGGYRSLTQQYSTRASRGYMAATPGTSVHGWGLAIDLDRSDSRGYVKAWLEVNGPTYGWVNPSWAKSRKWEPWHWEYEPGTDALGVYDY